jgi:hypothetical protein
MMVEEIRWEFTPNDLQPKNQANLTSEETNKGLHLKDDATFALLTAIFPHTIAMLDELDNIFGGWTQF